VFSDLFNNKLFVQEDYLLVVFILFSWLDDLYSCVDEIKFNDEF